MSLKRFAAHSMHCLRIGLTSIALFQFSLGGPLASTAQAQTDPKTATPIKHVIVIIGENRSFDHVFATYVPKGNQTVWNLLSEGIVKADGTPGPNFVQSPSASPQWTAAKKRAAIAFLLKPAKLEFGGDVLPAPLVGGAEDSYIPSDSLTLAEESENGLPADYYQYLVSGGTGLTSHTPDTRITNVNTLPAGPFQLTNGGLFTYNSYAASPVHRFYQMWQQLDCSHRTHHRDQTARDATANCSPGWKSLSAPATTAWRSLPTSAPTTRPAPPPPVKAPPPWAFTTCSRAMLRTSRVWPTPTP